MSCGFISFTVLLAGPWLVMGANASNATEDSTANVLVGWRAGPDTRGTLALVWSCLASIFACTWTVMHLNVPGISDSAGTKLLRRAKWLTINVLFPEFIFSKAVCDLRLALEELREFGQNLQRTGPISWTIVDRYNDEVELRWVVVYPRWGRLLYRLLGLQVPPAPPDAEAQQDVGREASPPKMPTLHCAGSDPALPTADGGSETATGIMPKEDASSQEQAGSVREPEKILRQIQKTTQEWTVVHSYCAQMGGLLYLERQKHRSNEVPAYYALTASKLTPRFVWDKQYDHPLVRLVLEKDDIRDKSKADWLLKGLAIMQITWLIINVACRHTTRLPITQLEVATVAFAIMAVAIYGASWWKPKDVSRPTILQSFPSGRFLYGVVDPIQPLMLRLRSPVKAAENAIARTEYMRVPNDLVWMQGYISPMFVLMAVSSMVFGGLHCLAWNFDFPTRVELVCWRVASLVSAILPVITLSLNSLLSYIADNLLEPRFFSTWFVQLKPLKYLPISQLWRSYNTLPSFLSWDDDELATLLSQQLDERNWEEPPSRELIEKAKESASWSDYVSMSVKIKKSQWSYLAFGVSWEKHTKHASNLWNRYISGVGLGLMFEEYIVTDLDPRAGSEYRKVLNFWLNYINNFPQRNFNILIRNSTFHCIQADISRENYTRIKKAFRKLIALQEGCNYAANFLTIFSGILYTSARLTVIVLLFTCLRAAPAGVYQIVPWTQFLPNIS